MESPQVPISSQNLKRYFKYILNLENKSIIYPHFHTHVPYYKCIDSRYKQDNERQRTTHSGNRTQTKQTTSVFNSERKNYDSVN